jgi:crotonobetainyl-CoA:carnitine CoA-transferase CaiB-like acyl-CoA transferase
LIVNSNKTVQNKEMFSGLRVVELASVLAGPSVGQFFAELGAEVIKVENLKTGGDVTRTWKVVGEKEGDLSAYFCSCNWGKKSVALDLTEKRGSEVVRRLIGTSDIVIASFKPGDAEKLGVSYQQLSEGHSSLIYGQITGYGDGNDRVGYDAVVQAEAGFMDLNGEKDGLPTKMPVALIDILAAHQLKEGLLLALLKRERTGKGGIVEVSLIQTAIASLANQATNWLVANKLPVRQGSAHPNIAPYGEIYKTSDGKRILVAVGNDRQFQNLCSVLADETLASGHEFDSNELRVVNRVELNERLAAAIIRRDSVELMSSLHGAMVPVGMVQTVREALQMTEAEAVLVHSGDLKGVRSLVAHSNQWPWSTLSPPPHFGEHTDVILGELEEGRLGIR